MELLIPLALGNLVDSAISDWIGPVLVGIIAVLAALFVFFGGDLFGKNGNISKAGKDVAKKINAVDLTGTTYSQDFLTR